MVKTPKRAHRANSVETHQTVEAEDKSTAVLTTNHGLPVSDNQNSLKSGARGRCWSHWSA